MNAAKREPEPTKGEQEILPLVLADFQARADAGLERYGTPLETNNGRNALMDAYQEAIDLVMYLRQAIAEMEANNGTREQRHSGSHQQQLGR